MANLNLNSDTAGKIASFICALHCAALPVLASMPAFASGWLVTGEFELLFVSLAIAIALTSVFKNYRRFKTMNAVILFFLTGITLLAAGLMVNESVGRFLSIGGGITLIWAHIKNSRECKVSLPNVNINPAEKSNPMPPLTNTAK